MIGLYLYSNYGGVFIACILLVSMHDRWAAVFESREYREMRKVEAEDILENKEKGYIAVSMIKV